MALLTTEDPVEYMVRHALVEAVAKASGELDQARANRHANAIGEVLAKMFRK